MHGMPGARLELHAPKSVNAELGIRLITVDRPGYGRSDRPPGRRLLDWPADVARLADHLLGSVLGAVQEVGIVARPWGFDPAQIRVPVGFWHGDEDDTAPFAGAMGLH